MKNPSAKTGKFFDVLNSIVDGGTLATLSKSEVKILLVFLRHSDAELVSFPGPALIASKCGLGVRKVYEAIAALKALGLIENIDGGGGRNRVAKRRIVVPETLSISRRVSPAKPCPIPAEFPVINPARIVHKTLSATGRRRTQEQHCGEVIAEAPT